MLVSKHIIFGFIFSLVVFLIFPWIGLIGFLLIFFTSVLIDVDHYLLYVFIKKDWSLRNACKFFMDNFNELLALPREERNKSLEGFFFLHGLDVLLIFFLLGIFVQKYFLFIFAGLGFHLLLDYIYQPYYWDKITKIFVFLDFRNLKEIKKFYSLKN